MPRDFTKSAMQEVLKRLNEDGSAVDTTLTGVATAEPPKEEVKPEVKEEKKEEPKVIGGPETEAGIDRTKDALKDQPESGFVSDVQHIPGPNDKRARGADKFDLAKLDESQVFNMPFIEAKSFDIPAILQVIPKDPAIRFRWVNFKNHEGGNYAMFKAIGFSNAQPADVQGSLGEHLIKEDGTIKFYDVVLMKVNVFRLMASYKANITKSIQQVGRWDERALKEAQRVWANETNAELISQMRQAGYNVEFFIPGKDAGKN